MQSWNWIIAIRYDTQLCAVTRRPIFALDLAAALAHYMQIVSRSPNTQVADDSDSPVSIVLYDQNCDAIAIIVEAVKFVKHRD